MTSDTALLRRYCETRDTQAFAELMNRYGGLVYGTCLRVTANEEDARDVTQDCFLELARRPGSVRTSLPGWLHRLARSRSVNAVRSAARRRRWEGEAAEAEALVQAGNPEPMWEEISPVVDEAVEALPDRYRVPLLQHYMGGRGQADIAVDLGLNQSTVSRRLKRAIEIVRRELRKRGITVSASALALMLVDNAQSEIPADIAQPLMNDVLAMPAAGIPARARPWGKAAAIAAACVAGLLLIGSAFMGTSGEKEYVMAANVVRDGEEVMIAGMANLNWEDGQENSVMRVYSRALRTAGEEEYTYEYLMGISGLAFRIQVHEEWCPSSPHACCGFQCMEVLKEGIPYDVNAQVYMEGELEDTEANRRKTRESIVASVDRGMPVPFGSEEHGLIVGYQKGGEVLLGRTYFDWCTQPDGVHPIEKWQWGYELLTRKDEVPERQQVIRNSLDLAVMLATTDEKFGSAYYSGFNAIEHWINGLRDEAALAALTDEQFKGRAHGNGYIYCCMIDARQRAVSYLRLVAEEMGPEAAPHVEKAADSYEQVLTALRDGISSVRMPWQQKDRANWTAGMREEQAQTLEKVLELEKEAIGHLKEALKVPVQSEAGTPI